MPDADQRMRRNDRSHQQQYTQSGWRSLGDPVWPTRGRSDPRRLYRSRSLQASGDRWQARNYLAVGGNRKFREPALAHPQTADRARESGFMDTCPEFGGAQADLGSLEPELQSNAPPPVDPCRSSVGSRMVRAGVTCHALNWSLGLDCSSGLTAWRMTWSASRPRSAWNSPGRGSFTPHASWPPSLSMARRKALASFRRPTQMLSGRATDCCAGFSRERLAQAGPEPAGGRGSCPRTDGLRSWSSMANVLDERSPSIACRSGSVPVWT
jgi:hypothetical protein